MESVEDISVLYDYQAFKSQRYGGISRYFYELLKNINNTKTSVLFTKNQYFNNLYHSKLNAMMSKLTKNTILNKSVGKLELLNKYYSCYQIKKQNFDVFHPTYYNPYFIKHIIKKPFVLTVHDMIHEKFPEVINKKDKTAEHKKLLVKKADRIIAISENTKKDLIQILNVDEQKIDVIYHGNSIINDNCLKNKVGVSNYLLYVGNRTIYKNFNLFVKSIAKILLKNNILLLCIGGGLFTNEEKQLIKSLKIESLVVQKNVSDTELPSYYSQALAFVFPSLYEGFGLPLIEAFSCNCPVICSNTSCFEEIAGSAAVYFNPYSEQSIYEKILYVIENELIRNQMILKGNQIAKNFTWEKTAKETLTTYCKAI